MSKYLQTRVEQAVERILEDEALTDALTDAQAKPLLHWATQEAILIAGDEAYSDEEVEERLRGLKSAVLAASQDATEESTAQNLIEGAKQALLSQREESPPIAKLLREEEERALLAKMEEPLGVPPEPHPPQAPDTKEKA